MSSLQEDNAYPPVARMCDWEPGEMKRAEPSPTRGPTRAEMLLTRAGQRATLQIKYRFKCPTRDLRKNAGGLT
jgi:hypothetical protein